MKYTELAEADKNQMAEDFVFGKSIAAIARATGLAAKEVERVLSDYFLPLFKEQQEQERWKE